MGAAVIRIVLQVLAGVGIGTVLDKVAADKLPSYPGNVAPGKDESGSFHIPKLVWFVVTMVAGAVLLKFIGKKLNIKILK